MLTLKSNLFKNKRGQQALVADLQKLAKALIVDDFANVSGKDSSHGFTYSLAKLIIKKITSDKDAKILILNDITLEMFYALLEVGYKRENIYIAFGKWNKDATVRDDNRLFNIMKNYIRANFEEEINTVELKEIFNMKFDLVIANPPYDKNLHLKILAKLADTFYNKGTEIISLQPIRWLQDPIAVDKSNSDYNKFKTSVYDRIISIDTILAKEAQTQFNIVCNMDLGVYHITKNKVNNFSGLISNTVHKIKNQLLSTPIFETNKKDGWRCRIPLVGAGRSNGSGDRNSWGGLGFIGPFYEGMRNGKHWYECYMKNQYTKMTDEISNSIKFNSEVEANNFVKSLQTKIGVYITYNLMVDVHVHPDTIMWLNDYSTEWTDERLCKHFNIFGYVSDDEAIPNSEWEEILNEYKKINYHVKEHD